MPARHLLWLALLLAAGCAKDPADAGVEGLLASSPAARKAAAEGLAGQRDPLVAAALARALRDSDRDVRCAAARALGRQDPSLAVEPLGALLASRGLGHECAYEPLGQLKDARAATPLLAAAARGPKAPALMALGALGPAAVTPLVNALRRETDPRRAEDLALVLKTAGGAAAIPPLLELLGENDRTANANAAMALGVIGDAQALPALVKAADTGLGSAPLALSRLGAPGLQELIARLDHPKPWQRDMAMKALAQARDPAVVAQLDRGLYAGSDAVVENSARVLAQLAGGATADFPLHQPAARALDQAWERGDVRVDAAAAAYYLRRFPEGDDRFLDALATRGDRRLATLFANSSSERLRKAAADWNAAH